MSASRSSGILICSQQHLLEGRGGNWCLLNNWACAVYIHTFHINVNTLTWPSQNELFSPPCHVVEGYARVPKSYPREGSICPSWWERHLTLPDLTLPKKTMCIRNAKRELKRWQSGPETAVRMMFQSPHAIITSRNAPLSTWPIVHFGFPNAVSKCSKGLYNSLHSHRVLHCGLLGRHHFHWGLICPQKFLLWALQGPRVMTAACSQVKSLKPCIYCGKEGRKLQGTFSYSTRKFKYLFLSEN